MRRHALLVLPLLIVVGLGFIGVTVASGGDDGGGGGAAADAPAGESAVDIADFAFAPVDLQVAAGTPVTWTNQDSSPHSIQDDSDMDLFEESDDLAGGDTFSFTYDQPGTYDYICGIHNYMRGTVTVS